MMWEHYHIFSWASMLVWAIAMVTVWWYNRSVFIKYLSDILIISGITLMSVFIVMMWISLERPPLRTLGETRLWYALFMPVVAFLILRLWKYGWLASFMLLMGLVFLIINLMKPEIHDKTLMPALQSVWFVPHVIVYIAGYSLLGASALVAAVGLFYRYFRPEKKDIINIADNLVYAGFGFLTPGLVFGALWAKQAWGHYWTWDPKETWALITWLAYIIYIHLRFSRLRSGTTIMWILVLSFAALLICWFGINYLPAAQNSVHIYAG